MNVAARIYYQNDKLSLQVNAGKKPYELKPYKTIFHAYVYFIV